MPLPSWVNPPNFMQSIQAGTQAGLALRSAALQQAAQAQRASEAAAHLQLQYEQLQAHQQQAMAQMQATKERAQAADLLRAQEQTALQQWRDQQSTIDQARLDETSRHNLAMETKSAFGAVKDGKIPALPVTDSSGKVLGWGVPGQGGAVHMLRKDQGDELTRLQRTQVLRDRLRDMRSELSQMKVAYTPEMKARQAKLLSEKSKIEQQLMDEAGLTPEDMGITPEPTIKVINIRQK